MQVIPIESLTDPRVAVYANLRDAELRHRIDPTLPVIGEVGEAGPGGFMAEGELVVRRLIDSPFRTASVLTTPTRLEAMRDALERLPAGAPVYLVQQDVMNGVVGFNMHRGVLAVGVRGAELSPEALAERCRVVLVLEDLVNHDNLGGMFRNAAALGGAGTGVLLSPRCADPLYRKSLRVSMGHVLGVPFARAGTESGERAWGWPESLATLRGRGFRVLALTPGPGARDIAEVAGEVADGNPRLALVLGSEGPGLSAGAAANADQLVRIPIAPGVDSLNVAVAGAVAMHRLIPRPLGTKGPG